MGTPHVINSGTGTYGVGEHIFRPGATPCEDEAVLDIIRAADEDWVEVREIATSDERAAARAELAARHPVEHGPAKDVLAKIDEAEEAHLREVAESKPVPSPEDIEQFQAEELVGKLTPADRPDGGFPCRAEGCDKVLATASGRRTHERLKHPDLTVDA